ncbi:MAG: glycosyltransferase family 39 protein [Actinobacteria bacterium]|nr:glycosyltransferase family 39 protein [Actinomycetota bacterium]
MPRLARAWLSLERFADGRGAAPTLVVAALVLYALVSVALPLAPGRDLGRYLVVYAQLFEKHVVYPSALVARPPGTPLVTGVLLEAGPFVAEAGAALLYAGSIFAWCAVARRFGAAAAVATAASLLLYPGYVLLFHRLSSDAIFATGFAVAAWLLVRAVDRPATGRVAALGVGVAGLVLIRPVAQVLLLLVLVPLFAGGTWRGRLQGAAVLVSAAVLPLLAWAGHNAARGDDFTIARGGGATLPLFRAFVADRIVRPENGPASRELERAVVRGLLPYEPYRSYEIDLERFFSSGSARMHEDLTGLSDRVWGWDDDYRLLGRVGREAVLAHPGTYARGVAGDVRDLLVWPLYLEVEPPPAEGQADSKRFASLVQAPDLPVPGEGEPIPSARLSSYLTTPDGSIREVWTSPTEHHIVYDDPADAARAAAIDRRIDGLVASFPDRSARPELVDRLNSASRWYPRPVVWLAVGLVALLVRRPRRFAIPLALVGGALAILVSTSLAVYAVAEYSVPVTPAFILLATTGLLGTRHVSNVRYSQAKL